MKVYPPVKVLAELKEFECQIGFFGSVPRNSFCNNFIAYSMDDGLRFTRSKYKDMRIVAANAGTCSCCDYIQIRGDAVLLIEETDVALAKKDIINKECAGMQKEDISNYADRTMKREFTKKVYGGLLMLYWLDGYNNLNLGLEYKKVDFLLIHNDNYDKQGSDSLAHSIKSSIKGELKDKVRDVYMMSAADAKVILQKCT